METMVAFWKAAYEVSADPYLALHAAEEAEHGIYKVVDYLAGTAPTVGKALQRISTYFPLVNDWLILECAQGEEECALRLSSQLGSLPPPPVEYTFSAILVRTRRLWGMEWSPRRVAFSYQRPDDLREYERLFRCPLVFDAKDSHLDFSRSFWDTQIPGSYPQLHRVLEEHAHQHKTQ